MQSDKTISKRAVFLIGGYEQSTADAFYRRMQRELRRFEKTWDATATLSPRPAQFEHDAAARIEAHIEGAKVETDFHVLTFDDIVHADNADPMVRRLWRYLVAFTDYVVSGTAYQFLARAWRFFAYFMYPFVWVVLILGVSAVVAALIPLPDVAGAPFVRLLIAAVLLVVFLARLPKRLFVAHLLDLWSFSHRYIHRREPRMDGRVRLWADHIAAGAASGDFDEILLFGHSTGGAMILDIAGSIPEVDRTKRFQRTPICVLTIGSTALKVGLHPAAAWFRDRVAAMAGESTIGWIDVQSRKDIINFHNVDPLAAMGLSPERPASYPIIEHIRLREMVDSEFYKTLYVNFFRIHFQFIMANDLRYKYDFYRICFGPAPVAGNSHPFPPPA